MQGAVRQLLHHPLTRCPVDHVQLLNRVLHIRLASYLDLVRIKSCAIERLGIVPLAAPEPNVDVTVLLDDFSLTEVKGKT